MNNHQDWNFPIFFLNFNLLLCVSVLPGDECDQPGVLLRLVEEAGGRVPLEDHVCHTHCPGSLYDETGTVRVGGYLWRILFATPIVLTVCMMRHVQYGWAGTSVGSCHAYCTGSMHYEKGTVWVPLEDQVCHATNRYNTGGRTLRQVQYGLGS